MGFNLKNLHHTGAAFVHAMVGADYPQMIWGTNDYKLASATMFSLFFGGNVFAPQTKIDGQPVQEFLQSHYIAAVKQVAKRLKGLPQVIGYDSLNEPSDGWIGNADLAAHESELQLGESPTPYQSMLLGDGLPTEIDFYEIRGFGVRKTDTRVLNPEGVRAWQDDRVGVWRENGVWDYNGDGLPNLLRPDHFARVNGREVDFPNDFLKPFINRFGREVRQVEPETLVFIEAVPHKGLPKWTDEDIPGVVDSSHWYDDVTLVTKRFRWYATLDLVTGRLALGPGQIRALFRRLLSEIKSRATALLGNVPVLIGEFGIPFDMHNKRAYRTGKFNKQTRALDASFQALEANLLHATLWNYTPDNSNLHGDLWNGEDLSIFSRDQQTNPMDINSGGRALSAFIRPYPIAAAGEPISLSFRMRKARFEFHFQGDPTVDAPTEIYVPQFHYGRGIWIEVSDGKYEYRPEEQRMRYWPENPAGEHWIKFEARHSKIEE